MTEMDRIERERRKWEALERAARLIPPRPDSPGRQELKRKLEEEWLKLVYFIYHHAPPNTYQQRELYRSIQARKKELGLFNDQPNEFIIELINDVVKLRQELEEAVEERKKEKESSIEKKYAKYLSFFSGEERERVLEDLKKLEERRG